MEVVVNLGSAIRAEKLKKVLNKPFYTPDGPKMFAVYVKNEANEILRVNFCDPAFKINRADASARKKYRTRHKCDINPGSRSCSNYWACKVYQPKTVFVKTVASSNLEDVVNQWDGQTFWDHSSLLSAYPELAKAKCINDEEVNPIEEDLSNEAELPKEQLNFIIDQSNRALASLKSLDPATLSLPEFMKAIAEAENSIADLNLIIEEHQNKK